MIVLIDNYDSFTFNLFHYLGELGGGRRRASQRQDFDRRRDRRRAGGHRALARPLHAERSRHLPRADRQGRADDSDPRRLPRPSGDRPGLRRQSGARARRRTARCSRSSTPAPACFAASTGRSSATRYHSLVVERASMPRELDRQRRNRRRSGDGRCACEPAGARRAVSSREHRLRARPSDAEEFPRSRRRLEQAARPTRARAARKSPAHAAS